MIVFGCDCPSSMAPDGFEALVEVGMAIVPPTHCPRITLSRVPMFDPSICACESLGGKIRCRGEYCPPLVALSPIPDPEGKLRPSPPPTPDPLIDEVVAEIP